MKYQYIVCLFLPLCYSINMPKSSNQKLKILRLYSILLEMTDESHPMSTNDLINELQKYGINAERKSIYSDIDELIYYGLDIIKCGGKKNLSYYVGERDFELAELKLLVDAVQSSKFISESKSNKLIKKLSKLCSRYDAKSLNRYVYVANRPKTINENVLYNIDSLHNALSEHKQISFQYLDWNTNKRLIPRKNGNEYFISPKALIWDDENYYLVGYDTDVSINKHFRVDKMKNISLLDADVINVGPEINPALYSGKRFGMYNGDTETVNIKCPVDKIGIFIDRFGKDITIRNINLCFCDVRIDVVVSKQFYGWLSGLGNDFVITGPEKVRDEYKQYLLSIISNYDKEEN